MSFRSNFVYDVSVSDFSTPRQFAVTYVEEFHRLYDAVAQIGVETTLYLPQFSGSLFREGIAKVAADHLSAVTHDAVQDKADEIAQHVEHAERQQGQHVKQSYNDVIFQPKHRFLHLKKKHLHAPQRPQGHLRCMYKKNINAGNPYMD